MDTRNILVLGHPQGPAATAMSTLDPVRYRTHVSARLPSDRTRIPNLIIIDAAAPDWSDTRNVRRLADESPHAVLLVCAADLSQDAEVRYQQAGAHAVLRVDDRGLAVETLLDSIVRGGHQVAVVSRRERMFRCLARVRRSLLRTQSFADVADAVCTDLPGGGCISAVRVAIRSGDTTTVRIGVAVGAGTEVEVEDASGFAPHEERALRVRSIHVEPYLKCFPMEHTGSSLVGGYRGKRGEAVVTVAGSGEDASRELLDVFAELIEDVGFSVDHLATGVHTAGERTVDRHSPEGTRRVRARPATAEARQEHAN